MSVQERERQTERQKERGGEKVVVLERAEDMSIAICLKLTGNLFMLSCRGRGDGERDMVSD